jgi:hypothetical protein
MVPRHMPLELSARPSLGGPQSSGISELTEGVRTSLPNISKLCKRPRVIETDAQSMRKGVGSQNASPIALKSAFSLSMKASGSADLFDDDDGVPPPASLLPPSEIDARSGPKPLMLGKME